MQPADRETEAPVYVIMQCVLCHEVDLKKEERLLRSGNPKCPYCGGLVRAQGKTR